MFEPLNARHMYIANDFSERFYVNLVRQDESYKEHRFLIFKVDIEKRNKTDVEINIVYILKQSNGYLANIPLTVLVVKNDDRYEIISGALGNVVELQDEGVEAHLREHAHSSFEATLRDHKFYE